MAPETTANGERGFARSALDSNTLAKKRPGPQKARVAHRTASILFGYFATTLTSSK